MLFDVTKFKSRYVIANVPKIGGPILLKAPQTEGTIAVTFVALNDIDGGEGEPPFGDEPFVEVEGEKK